MFETLTSGEGEAKKIGFYYAFVDFFLTYVMPF